MDASRQLFFGNNNSRSDHANEVNSNSDIHNHHPRSNRRGHKRRRHVKEKYFEELQIQPHLDKAYEAAKSFNKDEIETISLQQYSAGVCASEAQFPGDMEKLETDKAIWNAYKEHTASNIDASRLVLWSDGSGHPKDKQRGFGVAWRLSTPEGTSWSDWSCLGRRAPEESDFCMETLALYHAICKAHDLVSENPGRFRQIVIYSDSTKAIFAAQRFPRCCLGNLIVERAIALKSLQLEGIEVSLQWCPGHSNIPGNELADEMARVACGRSSRAEKVELAKLKQVEENRDAIPSCAEQEDLASLGSNKRRKTMTGLQQL